jgi:predicted nucleic acid-binding protein
MHFFDTSILVAAFDGQDSRHRSAFALFARHAERAAIAVHTIAETFSILTGRRGWRASQAFEILRTNTAFVRKISLTSSDYLQTCETAEGLGIRGGAVYDALILACARKAKATHIWTLNSRHFLLFAPELRGPIREPSEA